MRTIKGIEKELVRLNNYKIEVLKSRGVRGGFDSIVNETISLDLAKEVESVQSHLFENYKEQIMQFSMLPKNGEIFIFDFLRDFDFRNIKNNDFSKVTEAQYKKMKNKSLVYDRHLKLLQKKAGLKITLKSHLSRHSYASLMLMNGVDVYDIVNP